MPALVLSSVYLVLGTGRFSLFGGWAFYVNVLYLTLSSLLFIHFKKSFWLYFVFFAFLCLYAPIGLLYGRINEAFVFAIWGTYGSEADEFSKTLPPQYLVYSALSAVLLLFFYFITPKFQLKGKKIISFFAIFAIVTALGQPLKIGTTSTFVKAIKFFKQSLDDVRLYTKTKIEPKWQIKSVNPNYKNFVVVIGESARRDYFEAYGYGVPNTPFLREINGTFVDGYTATGLNTILALKHVLNEGGDFDLNIVDLANLAGFETFWLSNQGKIGYYDTANTIVAKRAKMLYFLSDDESVAGKFDENLVKKVGEILSQKSEKNRVIFLHTIGSHPRACSRLKSQDYKNYADERTFWINCYAKSIAQSDGDLRALYEILESNRAKTGESFSVIYFSDHGLTHNYKKNPPELLVLENASKEHFAIPLIKFSSDSVGRKFVKNESFANYFPQNFAHWLGVETANFGEFSDIFSDGVQADTLGARNLVKNKNPDPAVDISKFYK
ncbi:phosphoethanolamine transferase [Campylobacter sp. VBCF_06 NA8]|uniref:phosphoethanolamine transferase n=1 Tax=Campylobacter sp. VBCF_06 NA8 TaxID=2983822 RepID=UPI0022E9F62C|nr:phosphoethanolamine transferase [Campylobacter sp. VBCF_06 NA8]MDA3046327.1 phosphoethanolamine transferase [Campylobacter sp. VBCF_06 NA8]